MGKNSLTGKKMAANNKKNQIIALIMASIVCVSVAIFTPLAQTFGWFSKVQETPITPPEEIKPMSIQVQVSFDEYAHVEKSNSVDIALNPSPTDTNTLEKFRVRVKYEGTTTAALRVHIIHIWYYEGGSSPARANVQFKLTGMKETAAIVGNPDATPPIEAKPASYDPTVDTVFLDDSVMNSAYYYYNYRKFSTEPHTTTEQKLSMFEVPSSPDYINVITGLRQQGQYEKELRLRLVVVAEAVQLNRFQAIWGNLPEPKPTVPKV